LGSDGPQQQPEPERSADSYAKPAWIGRHDCGHCPYVHLVMLDEAPAPSDQCAYLCPIAGRESTLFGTEFLSDGTLVPHRAPATADQHLSDPACSVRRGAIMGRRILPP
jgi:hypothetical protein